MWSMRPTLYGYVVHAKNDTKSFKLLFLVERSLLYNKYLKHEVLLI